MTLSRVRPYIKGAFKFKGTVFSTEFVKRIPVILELMVKDVGFLIIRVDVGAIVEIEIDVFFFACINCFFNFKYIVQYIVSSLL